jgi:cellulose biosynthesis protein BcsE
LESIVRSVFDLRNSIGAYVKIAVKESGGQLRHSHEQLLLSMGANLTIPSETGLARMLSLLKSMQGQVYSHVLPHSFDEAMASVMDVTQMGYLTQANFIAAVSDLVERTQSLQVHNALVRLSLTPGLGVLETLRCCVMKRPGDLYTANTENVFVFLFACEEQDVGTTLDRLFRLPISVLFSTESRFLSAADIVNALEDFKLQSTGVVVSEDYTVALKNNAFLEPELPNNPVPTASVQTEIRPAFKAVPHALKLRHVTV